MRQQRSQTPRALSVFETENLLRARSRSPHRKLAVTHPVFESHNRSSHLRLEFRCSDVASIALKEAACQKRFTSPVRRMKRGWPSSKTIRSQKFITSARTNTLSQ